MPERPFEIHPTQLNEVTRNEDIEPIKVISSLDLGDPTLYDVLQWHIGKCKWCTEGLKQPPPRFGVKDTRHCPEYYDIAQEYSDYESRYISRGDP